MSRLYYRILIKIAVKIKNERGTNKCIRKIEFSLLK